MERNVFPFSAIVVQEDMKLALLLNLINPALGGVLIRGEKGTAKSTAVRGLCDLLEEIEVVKGCAFHCQPGRPPLCADCEGSECPETVRYRRRVVELPISATEDRVVGSLNIEEAIKKGKKEFEPGILAEANGNILYVDEINLLDDHIVDILLDSAAMGVNTVEREGVSYSHPSRFVLVGTMNPEEGDLRPQLLDRFGLVVEIRGEQDLEEFAKQWRPEQAALREQIRKAQESLDQIAIPEDRYLDAAKLGVALEVDGHRADITLLKTAQTLAAFQGDGAVARSHIVKAARMVLPHRMRKLPFDNTDGLPSDLEALLDA